MPELWKSESPERWKEALERYDEIVAAQGVAALPDLNRWYGQEFPVAVARRQPAQVTHQELVRVTEWKMARGVWRARNLALVRGNDPGLVSQLSAEALAAVPHPTTPIATLARLAGVGPATASAVAAAAAPAIYPFFDELVAAQVPGLGTVAFTSPYYARYADALRERATRLGGAWTPVAVERALWSHAGGKAGVR